MSLDDDTYLVFTQNTAVPFWDKEKEPKTEKDDLGYSGPYSSAKYTELIKPVISSLNAITKHLHAEGFSCFCQKREGMQIHIIIEMVVPLLKNKIVSL